MIQPTHSISTGPKSARVTILVYLENGIATNLDGTPSGYTVSPSGLWLFNGQKVNLSKTKITRHGSRQERKSHLLKLSRPLSDREIYDSLEYAKGVARGDIDEGYGSMLARLDDED